jgi:hypothetical protein
LIKKQPTNMARGREAFEIIQRYGSARMTSTPNLYKLCLDGVAIADEIIAKGVTPYTEVQQYQSLAGQICAAKFAAASLDDVLSVLIVEQPDHTWTYDVVARADLIWGSAEGYPMPTRELAIMGAHTCFQVLGASWEAAPDYEDVENPDDWCQVRIGESEDTDTYRVRNLPDALVREAVQGGMQVESGSFPVMQARLANLVI